MFRSHIVSKTLFSMNIQFHKMSNYKLIYFNVRGLAEPIRWILAMEKVPFEDYRVSWEEWTGTLKYELGNRQLPVLEFDGERLTQSITIMRYLARVFNYIPEDQFLAARCDELVDVLLELRLEFRPFAMEQDEAKKVEIKNNLNKTSFPKYYKIFNDIVGKTPGPFIAGYKLSWADLVLASWLEIWGELIVPPEFLNSFPALQHLRDNVFALPALADHLANRPKTWI